VLIEVIFTPVTYVIVNWLKQKEGINVYDSNTRYNPFFITEKGELS
jgi:queuosine precursor transporter